MLGLSDHPNLDFICGDLLDPKVAAESLEGCDFVAHLAAIVGDPACRKQPELAKQTNLEGSVQLYEKAVEKGVKKFIFASTCSNYGKMPDPNEFVSETSELSPISLYAETKVEFENYLLNQSRSSHVKPTCLRFATVYGLSARMRFDLTVNEFTRDIAKGTELEIFGAQFWRPYCHVYDLASSVLKVIESPGEKTAYEVYNVGDTEENYTKQMLIDEILKFIPKGKVSYVEKNEDPRDYRVNFDKISSELGFKVRKRIPDGIAEVARFVSNGVFRDPYSNRFKNVS